jgi:hypothetical protein
MRGTQTQMPHQKPIFNLMVFQIQVPMKLERTTLFLNAGAARSSIKRKLETVKAFGIP